MTVPLSLCKGKETQIRWPSIGSTHVIYISSLTHHNPEGGECSPFLYRKAEIQGIPLTAPEGVKPKLELLEFTLGPEIRPGGAGGREGELSEVGSREGRARTLEPDGLDSNPSAGAPWLCDFGHAPVPLCASVSSLV